MKENDRLTFIRSFMNPFRAKENFMEWIHEEEKEEEKEEETPHPSYSTIESDIASFLKTSEAEKSGLDPKKSSREDIARHLEKELKDIKAKTSPSEHKRSSKRKNV
jgi:hypothetical protein